MGAWYRTNLEASTVGFLISVVMRYVNIISTEKNVEGFFFF